MTWIIIVNENRKQSNKVGNVQKEKKLKKIVLSLHNKQ